MLDIEKIKNQVQRNCDISDSKHAGLFSVCGLALRLRDLYKWDNGLAPWVEKGLFWGRSLFWGRISFYNINKGNQLKLII